MVMVMLQPMRNEIMMLVVVAMLKKALSPNPHESGPEPPGAWKIIMWVQNPKTINLKTPKP